MSDKNLVACEEDHEMKTILIHFKKRETNENIEKLRNSCRNHKKDSAYSPHNRESFYQYLNDFELLNELE